MSDRNLKTPLKYEDGPEYCTVTDANGANFALTVQPALMKEMESAFVARGMVTDKLDGRLMAMPSSLNDACRTIEMAQSEIIKLRSQLGSSDESVKDLWEQVHSLESQLVDARSQLVKQQDLLHRSSECIGALLAWTSNWTVPFEAEDEWLGDKDVAKRLMHEIALTDETGDTK